VIADEQEAVLVKPESKVTKPVSLRSFPISKPELPMVAGTTLKESSLSPAVRLTLSTELVTLVGYPRVLGMTYFRYHPRLIYVF
jgi:hypothetical protein